jgi:hypothetical protein
MIIYQNWNALAVVLLMKFLAETYITVCRLFFLNLYTQLPRNYMNKYKYLKVL